MMLLMQLFQPLARHVGVNLRRGKVRVTEEHLHDPQVSAMIQQVRRERVSQDVR